MDDRVIPSRRERRVLGHARIRADCLALLPVARPPPSPPSISGFATRLLCKAQMDVLRRSGIHPLGIQPNIKQESHDRLGRGTLGEVCPAKGERDEQGQSSPELASCGSRGDPARSTRGLSTSFGYTGGVKQFHAAEPHVRRSSRSRSRHNADGIPEHLARNTAAEVSDAMNRVVDRLGETATDRFVARAAQQMLAHAKW